MPSQFGSSCPSTETRNPCDVALLATSCFEGNQIARNTRCEISKDARFAKLIQAKGVTRKMIGRDVHLQGLQFFKENQFENAAKWLREALTLDPTAERWNDWASAELACGRTEQAEAGYRQALKLDLDNGEAALNLGALYAASGRAAEALGWLERGMLAANETDLKLACKLQEQCRSVLATTRTAPVKPSALTEFRRAIQANPPAFGQTDRGANTIDLGEDLFLKQAQEGQFLLPKKDTGVSRAIDETGSWGIGDVALFKTLIKPGQTVVDAGAHIGHHSVVFSKAVGPRGRVLSFEPQTYLFNLLCANLALNACRNCVPFRVALGEAGGTLRMASLDYEIANNFGSLCISAVHPEWATGEEVEVTTLDAVLSTRKLQPDFIKIDVQTFELFVLRGAQQTLRDFRPIVWVEISPYWMSEVNSYDYREIYGFLRRAGYNLFSKKLEPLEQEFEASPLTDQREWDVIAIATNSYVPERIANSR